jgi:hypothetical protein
MTIRVSAFRTVPPFAHGLVRDLRVRWALEEAGLDYEEWLIGPEEQSSPDYRAAQPFGQPLPPKPLVTLLKPIFLRKHLLNINRNQIKTCGYFLIAPQTAVIWKEG